MLSLFIILLFILGQVHSFNLIEQFNYTINNVNSIFYMHQYKSFSINAKEYISVLHNPNTYCKLKSLYSNDGPWYLYNYNQTLFIMFDYKTKIWWKKYTNELK